MGHVMPAWEAGDHAAVRKFLAESIQRLADGGCDFFACPDNTAHISLELTGPDLPLPGLDIGDVVAEQAAKLGMKRVAVLGTRFTMAGPVYRRALPAVGIEPRFPNDEERADIDRIIFDELLAPALHRDHRAAEARRGLRRRRARLHRDPAAGHRKCVAAADTRFDAAARPRGVRSLRWQAAVPHLARWRSGRFLDR
jgi:aspartate/glutamate racemase